MIMKIRNLRSLVAVAPILMIGYISQAQAQTMISMSEQAKIESTSALAVTEAHHEESTYLAKIINKSTGEIIEIDCIKGSTKSCDEFGFFKVLGARNAKPFAIVQALNFYNPDGGVHFSRASHWVSDGFGNDDGELGAEFWVTTMSFFTVPVLMYVVDTVLLPYDLAASQLDRSIYRRAVRKLAQALNSGSSISISARQYHKIIDMAVANSK